MNTLLKNKFNTNIENNIAQIINELMNKHSLNINGEKWRLCEVELYLYNREHPDPFTHKNKDQKTVGEWYFHKFGNTYKGGTFKGLDFTFGKDCYGGILIRAIKNTVKNERIEGPCKVVDYILQKNNKESIKEFVDYELKKHKMKTFNALNKNSGLFIESDNDLQEDIYTGPRVGLTLKKYSEDKLNYIVRDYRFITEIDKVKKFKSVMQIAAYKKNNKTKISDKYLKIYNESKNIQINDYKDKNLSTSQLISLYGYLYNK